MVLTYPNTCEQNKMTKLLMLIESMGGGGGERVVSELSLNLSPNIKHKIVIRRNEISYPTNEPPLSMNLNFIERNPIDRLLKYIYSLIVASIKYRKLINKYKPDISLSLLTLDNFINVLSNIGNKKTKVIVSVHVVLSMNFRKSVLDRITKFLIKILYNKADLIICVSIGVRDEFIRDFKIDQEKIIMLYNPMDIEKIQHLAKEEVNDEWFDGEMPILVNMGSLTEPKGQWHLIRAFSKVIERKQCKLVIFGNGELKSYLDKLVRDLDLSNDVRFMGWQDNPFKYISKSSIFVYSSIREALPCALIEAMACGCPVISTDCKYGPSEILGNGKFGILTPPMDGILYKAKDPITHEENYLADEIIKMLENDNLRRSYSKKGKKRVKNFNKERHIKEYKKMMRKLISVQGK